MLEVRFKGNEDQALKLFRAIEDRKRERELDKTPNTCGKRK